MKPFSKNTVYWDALLCDPVEVNWRFGGKYCQLLGWEVKELCLLEMSVELSGWTALQQWRRVFMATAVRVSNQMRFVAFKFTFYIPT
jgi:hypothetical protein